MTLGLDNFRRPPIYAIVGGRWQPPHLGHEWLIGYVASRVQRLVIGIVNPDPMNPPEAAFAKFAQADNPLSYWERLSILRKLLARLGVLPRVRIVPMWHPRKSLNREENYLPPRLRRYWVVPALDMDEWAKAADLQSLHEDVRMIPELDIPAENLARHAVSIRRYILEDDPAWKSLVPPETAYLIDHAGVSTRLRRRYERDLAARNLFPLADDDE